MLKPFQILWELIEFGLQALFLYGLAIIFCIGLVVYTIARTGEDQEIRKEWNPKQEKIEYIKKVYPKKEEVIPNKPECIRPSGCRILEDGTIEY